MTRLFVVGLPVPHILVLGFQELVQLRASQIISADPERRGIWEGLILKLLADRYPNTTFSLLAAHQVVATSISIFIRSSLIQKVKNVEIASKKTGLGGMTGNKGSVAIRMNFSGTDLGFVCSHFSAGQVNIEARNYDMEQASRDLTFAHNKTIAHHSNIIWMGDFNYRVDLARVDALDLIQRKKLQELKRFDQLGILLSQGLVFPGFEEPVINFAPTYKYDVGTNIYDTRYLFSSIYI